MIFRSTVLFQLSLKSQLKFNIYILYTVLILLFIKLNCQHAIKYYISIMTSIYRDQMVHIIDTEPPRSSGNHYLLKEKKEMKPRIGISSNTIVKFKYHI